MEIPYEATPEILDKIQKEYETLVAEFLKWGNVHGGLVPPSISTFSEVLHDKCIGEMTKHVEAGDHEGASREPIIVICSALSFGMHLSTLGYKIEEMTMPSVLTSEDERRLLSGSDSGSGIEDTPGEATGTGV